MPLGKEVGLSPGDFVLDRDPAPFPKRRRNPGAEPPNFRPMSIVAKRLNGSRWHIAWRYRPWFIPHCARWGHSSPLQIGGRAPLPQFSAHLYCGKTSGCIKMPLGMQVGRSPGDFVFDVYPATPEKGHTHPTQLLAHVYAKWLDG